GSLKTLNPSQHFAFSAGKHLDMAKSPGIPKKTRSGINLWFKVLNLSFLLIATYATKTSFSG
ncbi:hypothetical protein, partial [Bartonella elizabethae]|uniref:hypothetical protein n=1 Tax=Bartonella elizabethae TaxID=807 RepID=UPI001AEBCF3B